VRAHYGDRESGRLLPRHEELSAYYNLDNGAGRIRVDDFEMKEAVQAAVRERWEQVTDEGYRQILDVEGYQREFLRLFGFGMPGVDYGVDIDPEVAIPSIDG
jgi:trans-2-enoyl-CoA reductase